MADEFIVDVMPKACGLSFDDLQLFMHRVQHRGKPINVLDLYVLKATNQTTRARDIEDLRHIEAAGDSCCASALLVVGKRSSPKTDREQGLPTREHKLSTTTRRDA